MKEIVETIITETLPQLNVRDQTTGPGSSDTTTQDKGQNKQTNKQNLGIL